MVCDFAKITGLTRNEFEVNKELKEKRIKGPT